jgi:hypothetical protein
MARENVDLARQVMDVLGQRDLSRLISLADPEVEWRSFFAIGESGGVYRGYEGTRQYVSDLSDAWEVVRADVDDEGLWGCGSRHERGESRGRAALVGREYER